MKKVKTEEKKENFIKLYVPELRQLFDGDEKTCLMMAQLEYWFGKYPNGFYKFMDIPKGENPGYKTGQSWAEEMGMSVDKIKNGLASICESYNSYTDYKKQEGDKFKGKFYLRYFHKPSHQMYFLRNHELVNRELKNHSLEELSIIFREKCSVGFGNSEKPSSTNEETDNLEVIEGEFVFTENNSKNNSKNNSQEKQEREERPHSISHFRENDNQDSSNEFEQKNKFNTVKSSYGVKVPPPPVPFPTDFEITEELIAWAMKNNDKLDREDVLKSIKKFVLEKVNEQYSDWEKELKKWLLNERPAPKNVGKKLDPEYEQMLKESLAYWESKPESDFRFSDYGL